MTFGNVAPAPVSFTWAAAGAALKPSAAATPRSALRFIVASRSGSEGDLGLEQRLRAHRFLRGRRRALEAHMVEIGQEPEVRAQLIGNPADEPRLLVVCGAGVRVGDVYPADERDLGVRDMQHA